MSKAVMLSIQPKWCELIASGKKTIEVRKTRPKLETPFKVYIYETKDKNFENIGIHWADGKDFVHNIGKVIGEFICDDIKAFDVPYPAYSDKMDKTILEKSCIRYYDLHRYAWHDCLYAWNISDLVIYDKPKELNEFYKEDFEEILSNWEDLFSIGVPSGCIVQYPPEPKKEDYIVKRPPQSWFYVEELNE